MLLRAGFTCKSGKGSHTKWYHPLLDGIVALSGKDGNDAKFYQEKDVLQAIQVVKQQGEN